MGRECRSLLPADQVAHVISGDEVASVGLAQLVVSGLCRGHHVQREATQAVWNLLPRNIDWLRQQLAVAGVERLYGGSRCSEFSFRRQRAKCVRGSVIIIILFEAKTRKDHAGLAEELPARIPDQLNRLLGKRDSAINVVYLLPEARRLPSDLIERRHLHAF